MARLKFHKRSRAVICLRRWPMMPVISPDAFLSGREISLFIQYPYMLRNGQPAKFLFTVGINV